MSIGAVIGGGITTDKYKTYPWTPCKQWKYATARAIPIQTLDGKYWYCEVAVMISGNDGGVPHHYYTFELPEGFPRPEVYIAEAFRGTSYIDIKPDGRCGCWTDNDSLQEARITYLTPIEE